MANFETYTNTSMTDISDWYITSDGNIVHKYSITGTAIVVYVALARTTNMVEYSSIHSNRNLWEEWLGDITTKRLPADIEALPHCTSTRLVAVRAFQQKQHELAEKYIREGYPQDFE